jgi:hypothetical protein
MCRSTRKNTLNSFRSLLPALVCRFVFALLLVLSLSAGEGRALADTEAVKGRPANQGDELTEAVLYRPIKRDTSDLSALKRTIRVLVHYGRTEFFVANGKPWGVEYEALTEYERFLNSRRHKV